MPEAILTIIASPLARTAAAPQADIDRDV